MTAEALAANARYSHIYLLLGIAYLPHCRYLCVIKSINQTVCTYSTTDYPYLVSSS